jgi:hypothetical protein
VHGVPRDWRKLHNEELYGMFPSANIYWVVRLRRIGWAGHVARMWYRRVAYRDLVVRPDAKRPCRRPRLRWEYNIKIYRQEVVGRSVDWIDLAQDTDRWRALVNDVINLRVP